MKWKFCKLSYEGAFVSKFCLLPIMSLDQECPTKTSLRPVGFNSENSRATMVNSGRWSSQVLKLSRLDNLALNHRAGWTPCSRHYEITLNAYEVAAKMPRSSAQLQRVPEKRRRRHFFPGNQCHPCSHKHPPPVLVGRDSWNLGYLLLEEEFCICQVSHPGI